MTDLERKEQSYIAWSIIEMGFLWGEEADWPYVMDIIRPQAEKGNVNAQVAYGDFLLKNENIEEAERWYKIATGHGSMDAHEGLFGCRTIKRIKTAAETAKLTLSEDPSKAAAGLVRIEKLAERDPENILSMLIDLYLAIGHYEGAEKFLNRVENQGGEHRKLARELRKKVTTASEKGRKEDG